MKKLILLTAVLLIGCASHTPPKPKEVILKFQADIPVTVTISKNCEGNWNFCQYQ